MVIYIYISNIFRSNSAVQPSLGERPMFGLGQGALALEFFTFVQRPSGNISWTGLLTVGRRNYHFPNQMHIICNVYSILWLLDTNNCVCTSSNNNKQWVHFQTHYVFVVILAFVMWADYSPTLCILSAACVTGSRKLWSADGGSAVAEVTIFPRLTDTVNWTRGIHENLVQSRLWLKYNFCQTYEDTKRDKNIGARI